MQVFKATSIWIDFHKINSKKKIAKRYEVLIGRFNQKIADRIINQITSDEILSYRNRVTEGNKPYQKN